MLFSLTNCSYLSSYLVRGFSNVYHLKYENVISSYKLFYLSFYSHDPDKRHKLRIDELDAKRQWVKKYIVVCVVGFSNAFKVYM